MNLQNAIFLLSESGIALLFALCVAGIWRRVPRVREISGVRGSAENERENREKFQRRARDLSVLFSAAIFAAIFENLNVIQIHGRGSYSYSADFHVFVGQVPLFVILAWAVIFWTAMRLSDASALRERGRIFNDAILAVTLDLAFDATAIRHNFWMWHGVKFDEAWFGVPAGNFFGWFYVALVFALCTRFLDLWTRKGALNSWFRVLVQLFAVPVFAFVLYRALENSNNALLTIFGWRAAFSHTDKLALGVFFAQLCLAVWWTLRQKSRRASGEDSGIENSQIEYSKSVVQMNSDAESGEIARWELWFARAVRVSFHVFAIAGICFWTSDFADLNAQKPAIIGVAGLMWAFDIWYLRRLKITSK